MRCKNCGWENPDGSQKCERCSSPLDSAAPSGAESQNRYRQSEASQNLRSTVREAAGNYSPNCSSERPMEEPLRQDSAGNENQCRNCGYILSPGMNVCPQCGTPQRRQTTEHENNRSARKDKLCPKCGAVVAADARFCPTCGQQFRNSGTVNAWDNPQGGDFCSLRPIPWSRENAQYNAISYSGERIVLNRANTDPNNQTITSHEQAVLTYDGRDWYIEDMSEQHSTMLRISKRTKLQSGDIIALGNRLFEFND